MKRRRCAACDHHWRPRVRRTSFCCPKCRSQDVFDYDTPEDINAWDESAKFNADARHLAEMTEDSD